MSGAFASFAAVSCDIEIYPYEGGNYVIQKGQIRQVIFEKKLHGGDVGRAIIQLAPGGPNGSESSPDWIEILTPMSFVLIGMTRGGRSALVFSGVVVRPAETQEWRSSTEESFAGRFPTFECADFAWFFRMFNYYSLQFMGLTANVPLGSQMGFVPQGIVSLLDQGIIGGQNVNPADVAQLWYKKVMVGQGGILGKTFIPYSTEQQIQLGDILANAWENYPNATIPYSDYFYAHEGTWMDKFQYTLPFPWYEFFITTAPRDAYTFDSGASAPGWVFTMRGQPQAAPAGPQLVARINPIPALNISVSEGKPQGFGELDMSRWNALPINAPSDTHTFFESTVSFEAEGAANFYYLNPTAMGTFFVMNNANNIPFAFTGFGAADPASVHRYGFRPAIATFSWFVDMTGSNAQNNGSGEFPSTIGNVLGRYISQFHPQPLMARAEVTMPLTPDVSIGNRWEHAPFKDNIKWQFYIEAVRHNFVFGGRSTTTLSLSRGLPSDIYADSSKDSLLYAIHLGNAMRQNGIYTKGLPKNSSEALTLFSALDGAKEIAGQLSQVFVTPQMQ